MIGFGREITGALEHALRREWLVTNGLGGYAAGTVAGANTRRYHGWLVAALNPPVGRVVLVAKCNEVAYLDGETYPLTTNEYADGTVHPHGYYHLESFRLEGTIPVFTYALAEALLEKRLWMVHGANTTYVTYTLQRTARPLTLGITPLVTFRSHHEHVRGNGWMPVVDEEGRKSAPGPLLRVDARPGAPPYWIGANQGEVDLRGGWHWNFKHRLETERGLDDVEDLFAAATLMATLYEGETLALVLSTELPQENDWRAVYKAERARQAELLRLAQLEREPPWVQQLALAADQFIVSRPSSVVRRPPDEAQAEEESEAEAETGLTVIAGYPWFTDWGRDTMISLPGLTLALGRSREAACILRTFAQFVDRGMLPNRFPEPPVPGMPPQPAEYNTVDATLWYFWALNAYLQATGDMDLIEELYPTLVDIVEWHKRGTHYNIHMDASDGLLWAGEPGVQLTWMDAKVGDWVVTPRIGKPVEINALWHNALVTLATFGDRLGRRRAGVYQELASQVEQSFRERFWYAEGGYLYDVIDGPGGADAALRPNQLLAVCLPYSPLDGVRAQAVVDVCARHLLTSYGLRSLAPGHPAYQGRYLGDRLRRDGAYHQGTVWAWLLGPFVTAHLKVYGDPDRARSYLTPMAHHLSDAGLGTISEIFDGDPPFTPRGCFAQAWSVAEVLRAWMETHSARRGF
ncbi:MAG: glycogen debranching protein [Chloroflexota bacterium]